MVALLDACLVTGYGSQSPAGWTKPYTGANKAVFKQGANSCGFYLRVQDDGPGAGGAREARLTGYRTMSDVDTGTFEFPQAAQGLGATVAAVGMRKSDSLDNLDRHWWVLADSRTVYMYVSANATGVGSFGCFGFGDFYSYDDNDAYRCFLAGHERENITNLSQDYMVHLASGATSNILGRVGGVNRPVVAGPSGGVGGSTLFCTAGDLTVGVGGGYSAGVMTVIRLGGAVYTVAPWLVGQPLTLQFRGRMRGFYQSLNPQTALATGDVFEGSGEFTGKKFLAFRTIFGNLVFEISDTLDTNT
ncbi:MAG: hypothetical protein ACOYB3_01650 [Azonexus sp.]